MQIHLSDISSSEGMRIQKTAEFGMDTITFQSGSFPVLAKEPIELTITNTGDRNLEIRGTGKITVGIPCDRCLEEVSTEIWTKVLISQVWTWMWTSWSILRY